MVVETLQRLGLAGRGVRGPCDDRRDKTLPRELQRANCRFLRNQAAMKHALERILQPRPRPKAWVFDTGNMFKPLLRHGGRAACQCEAGLIARLGWLRQ
jgi:hypothetical protein